MALWLSRRVVLWLALAAAGAGCASPPAPKELVQSAPRKPTVVFMTDFGTANDAVAICKAVIAGIAPDARIADITHQVTPFQIDEASRFLYGISRGCRSRRRHLAKSDYREIPEGPVLCPARQRTGQRRDRSRRTGRRARDHKPELDDPGCRIVHLSRP